MEIDSNAPARVTVTRRSPEDVRQRQLVLSMDGKPWATLLFGHAVTMDLEPGEHHLRIHNTLVWKTVDFTVAPGQHVRFTAANRAGWGTYSLLSMLGVGPLYVSVTREEPQ